MKVDGQSLSNCFHNSRGFSKIKSFEVTSQPLFSLPLGIPCCTTAAGNEDPVGELSWRLLSPDAGDVSPRACALCSMCKPVSLLSFMLHKLYKLNSSFLSCN